MAGLVQRAPARQVSAGEFAARVEHEIRVAEEVLAVLRHQHVTIQRRR